MQKQMVRHQGWLTAGAAFAIITMSGCQSGLPKWNLFAGRGEPSPEALAGTGPSATYPLPPSESASTDAIVSTAGGVGPMGGGTALASNTSPSVTTPAMAASGPTQPNLNMAAANANGFMTSNLGTSRGSLPAVSAGYQFGTNNSPSGRTAAAVAKGAPSTAPTYAVPTSYPLPGQNGTSLNPSANSITTPLTANPATASPMTATGAIMPPQPKSGGLGGEGFTMPADLGAAISNPASSQPTASQPFTPKATQTGMSLPGTPASTMSGAGTPNYRTASAASAPSHSPSIPTTSSPSGGYTPGSTSGSSGYPRTSGYGTSSTGGSYFR